MWPRLAHLNNLNPIIDMYPRFITKKIHALIDYPVAVVLMALPFALGLGDSAPLAKWLSVIVGVAALLLTVLTDHQTGIFRVLSYKFHLIVDFSVGVVFALAPLLFGFSGIDAVYYWANAGAVLLVVSMHKPEGEPTLAVANA